MANEGPGREEPLSATIREQLRTKDELEALSAEERAAGEAGRQRVERQKEGERAEVARHLEAAGVAPAEWPAARSAAHARGRAEARLRDWGGRGLPLAGIALALLGFALGRRVLVAVGLPLLGGALLLRRRTPAGGRLPPRWS